MEFFTGRVEADAAAALAGGAVQLGGLLEHDRFTATMLPVGWVFLPENNAKSSRLAIFNPFYLYRMFRVHFRG